MYVVIQFAKLSGFSPIVTTVSPHNNAPVTSLGATYPVDRALSLSSLASLPSLSHAKPLLVFDTVGSTETQQAGWNLIAPGGTLITIMFYTELDQSSNNSVKKEEKKTVIVTYGTVHCAVNRKIGEELYGVLSALLESGDVKVQ